ncbi:MAG: GldG family protein [Thiohalocapsa sp.]
MERRAADAVFALLLLAILLLTGWHAARHEHYWDWSSSGRNSLSPESTAVLDRLEDPLRITVYAPVDHQVSRGVEQLLARYRKHPATLVVDYVDPQRYPELARQADVELIGQMVIEYRGLRETQFVISESALTNAIARLTRPETPWIGVLEGHGERAISGAAGPDLGRFAQLLHQRGFQLLPLDLARAPAIPTNLDLLLLSMPSIALFPGEVEALVDYVDSGGSLIWLMDPPRRDGDLLGLEPLAEHLGIRALPGQIVDAAASEHGLESPTSAIVDDWSAHPLSQGLSRAAIFPGSVALAVEPGPGWRLATTLTTGELSWNETGPVRGEIDPDAGAGEQRGPLALAIALDRPAPDADSDAIGSNPKPVPRSSREPTEQQRVIVTGDGDFLSNAHLANGINQALGLRMTRWLAGREDLVSVPSPISDRDALTLSPVRGWAIVGLGLVGFPVLLAGIGIAIRWQRGRA